MNIRGVERWDVILLIFLLVIFAVIVFGSARSNSTSILVGFPVGIKHPSMGYWETL